MSRCGAVARPLARQLLPLRSFATTARQQLQEQAPSSPSSSSTAPPPPSSSSPSSSSLSFSTTAAAEPSPLDLDPDTVLPQFEAPLIKAGKMPIGSRRRRVALRSTMGGVALPFEQLPYQAFQEARAILAADRADKLAQIGSQLGRIARLEAADPAAMRGGQRMRDTRLASLRRHVDRLKILADANDPLVKKRFEDGLGDMNKPIYRYYAEKKWRAYDRRLIVQRIKQFSIVPDLLPKLDPTADVQLFFRRAKVSPGAIVDSAVSELAPRLRIQLFDRGERLVTVAVVDADVPDLDADAFSKRCHFLAANVPLSPTSGSLPLARVGARGHAGQLALPWLPPAAQKGSPYHRLAIVLFEQRPGEPLDVDALATLPRDGFSLKSLRDKFALAPFGFTMFRSVWDDNTADVMARHALPGADVELRPMRVRSLKPPVKPRGWEAKRQGPKYRHLWKYTKRIRGISNARGWIKKR
ncbi:mitochondrial 54S ribosomal protein YmL35 [Purpureocillium takamizusanense]|uniref:Large ribosomal subunit protein mL38 n=1 Tax=Purpureocillium takamizusanense TaxID=2060973 RepID=A0A9Q8QHR3_9HYPO|nr:mitochondrial 54S ribosomal protein YmL35 [Purpureocillium takamizusanense]UNI19467.1 mitochondrial 54S ribosomal protein YmL35 [Purpureocillium takamizusanense]